MRFMATLLSSIIDNFMRGGGGGGGGHINLNVKPVVVSLNIKVFRAT